MAINVGEVAVNFVSNLDKIFKQLDDLTSKISNLTTGKAEIKVVIDNKAIQSLSSIERGVTKISDMADKFSSLVRTIFDSLDGRMGNTAKQLQKTVGNTVENVNASAEDGITRLFNKISDGTKRLSPLILGQLLGIAVLVQKLVSSGFDLASLIPSIFKTSERGSLILVDRLKEFTKLVVTLNVPGLIKFLASGVQGLLGISSVAGLLLGTFTRLTSLTLNFLSKRPENSLARFTQLIVALNEGLVGLLNKTKIAIERLFFITSALTTISSTIILIQTGVTGLSGMIVPIAGFLTTAVAFTKFIAAKFSSFLLKLRAGLGDGRAATTLFLRSIRQMFPIFQAIAENAKVIARIIRAFAKGGLLKRLSSVVKEASKIIRIIKDIDGRFKTLLSMVDSGINKINTSILNMIDVMKNLMQQVRTSNPVKTVENTGRALVKVNKQLKKTKDLAPKGGEFKIGVDQGRIKRTVVGLTKFFSKGALSVVAGLFAAREFGAGEFKTRAALAIAPFESQAKSALNEIAVAATSVWDTILNPAVLLPKIGAFVGDIISFVTGAQGPNIGLQVSTAVSNQIVTGIAFGVGAIITPFALKGAKNLIVSVTKVLWEETTVFFKRTAARIGGYLGFVRDKVVGWAKGLINNVTFLGARAASKFSDFVVPYAKKTVDVFTKVISLGNAQADEAFRNMAKRGGNIFVDTLKGVVAGAAAVIVSPFSAAKTLKLVRMSIKSFGRAIAGSFKLMFGAAEFVASISGGMMSAIGKGLEKVRKSSVFTGMFRQGPLMALGLLADTIGPVLEGVTKVGGFLTSGLGKAFGRFSGRKQGPLSKEATEGDPVERTLAMQKQLAEKEELLALRKQILEKSQVSEGLQRNLQEQLAVEKQALLDARIKTEGLGKIANIISTSVTDFDLALEGNTEILGKLEIEFNKYRVAIKEAAKNTERADEELRKARAQRGQVKAKLHNERHLMGPTELKETEAELTRLDKLVDELTAELANSIKVSRETVKKSSSLQKLIDGMVKGQGAESLDFAKQFGGGVLGFDKAEIERVQGEIRNVGPTVRNLVVEFDEVTKALDEMRMFIPDGPQMDSFDQSVASITNQYKEMIKKGEVVENDFTELGTISDQLNQVMKDSIKPIQDTGNVHESLTGERQKISKRFNTLLTEYTEAIQRVREDANSFGGNSRAFGRLRSDVLNLVGQFGITEDVVGDSNAVFKQLNDLMVAQHKEQILKSAQEKARTAQLNQASKAEVDAILRKAQEEVESIKTLDQLDSAVKSLTMEEQEHAAMLEAANDMRKNELKVTAQLQKELGLTDDEVIKYNKALNRNTANMNGLDKDIAFLRNEIKFMTKQFGLQLEQPDASGAAMPSTKKELKMATTEASTALIEEAAIVDQVVLSKKKLVKNTKRAAAALGAVSKTSTAQVAKNIDKNALKKLLAAVIVAGKGQKTIRKSIAESSKAVASLKKGKLLGFAEALQNGLTPLEAFSVTVNKLGNAVPKQLGAMQQGFREFLTAMNDVKFAKKVIEEFGAETVESLVKVAPAVVKVKDLLTNQLFQGLNNATEDGRKKAKALAADGIIQGLRDGLKPNDIKKLVEDSLNKANIKGVKLRGNFAKRFQELLTSFSAGTEGLKKSQRQGAEIVLSIIKGMRSNKNKVGQAADEVAQEIADTLPSSLPKRGPLRRAIMNMSTLGTLIGQQMLKGVEGLKSAMDTFLTGGMTDVVAMAIDTINASFKTLGTGISTTFLSIGSLGESVTNTVFKIAGALSLLVPIVGKALRPLLNIIGAFVGKLVKFPFQIASAITKATTVMVSGIVSLVRNATSTVFNFIKETSDKIADLKRQAVIAGVDLEQFEVISRAFDTLGAQASEVQQAFIQLQSNLARISEEGGLGDTAVIFGKLGVTFDALQDAKPDELFLRIVQGLREGVLSAQEQDQALQLIGAQFSNLKGVILDGTLDIEKALVNAAKIKPIDEGAVKNAQLFQRVIKQVEQIFDRIKIIIFEEVAPFFEGIFEQIDSEGSTLVERIVIWIRFIVSIVVKSVVRIVEFVKERWFDAENGTENFFKDITAFFSGLFTFLFKSLVALLKAAGRLAVLVADGILSAMPSKIKSFLQRTLTDATFAATIFIVKIAIFIGKAAEGVWVKVKNFGLGIIQDIVNFLGQQLVNVINDVIDLAGDVGEFLGLEKLDPFEAFDFADKAKAQERTFAEFFEEASVAAKSFEEDAIRTKNAIQTELDQILIAGDLESAFAVIGDDVEALNDQIKDLTLTTEELDNAAANAKLSLNLSAEGNQQQLKTFQTDQEFLKKNLELVNQTREQVLAEDLIVQKLTEDLQKAKDLKAQAVAALAQGEMLPPNTMQNIADEIEALEFQLDDAVQRTLHEAAQKRRMFLEAAGRLQLIEVGEITAGRAEALKAIGKEMGATIQLLGDELKEAAIAGIDIATEISPEFKQLFDDLSEIAELEGKEKEAALAAIGTRVEEAREKIQQASKEFDKMRTSIAAIIPNLIKIKEKQLEFAGATQEVTGRLDKMGEVFLESERKRLAIQKLVAKRHEDEKKFMKERLDIIKNTIASSEELSATDKEKALADFNAQLVARSEALTKARDAFFKGDLTAARAAANEAQTFTDKFNEGLQKLAPKFAEGLKINNPISAALIDAFEQVPKDEVIAAAKKFRDLVSEGLGGLGVETFTADRNRKAQELEFQRFMTQVRLAALVDNKELLSVYAQQVGLIEDRAFTLEEIEAKTRALMAVSNAELAAQREIDAIEKRREARKLITGKEDFSAFGFDLQGARQFRNDVLAIRNLLADADLSAQDLVNSLREKGIDIPSGFTATPENVEQLKKDVEQQLQDREVQVRIKPVVEKFTGAVTGALGSSITGAIDGSLVESIRSAREEARKQGREIRDWIFVLADFSKKIFDTMLNDLVSSFTQNLQKSLTDSLSSVLGEVSSLAVQGALLIGSAVLSKLQENATVVQDTVDSVVDSTEAVRGVISGATTVAIKETEEAFRASNRGIELRLDVIIDLMRRGTPITAGAGLGTTPATTIP